MVVTVLVKVVGSVVGVAVLLGFLGVGAVRTGLVGRVLDECTDDAKQASAAVADEVRLGLPERVEPVVAEGYCGGEPYPVVTTSTSAERASLAELARERWGCRAGSGSPAYWDCDMAGQRVEVTLDADGEFVVRL